MYNNTSTDSSLKSEVILEEIKLYALGLMYGDTINVECPFCQAPHENKFYITREVNGLLYTCHRASCGARGFIPSKTGVQQDRTSKPFVPKLFTRPTTAPSENLRWLYLYYYGVHMPENWSVTNHRLIVPVRTLSGHAWGVWAKKLVHDHSPGTKTILYPELEFDPKIHFPKSGLHEIYTVVEDPISAQRLAQYGVPCFALLGTHLKEEAVTYLIEWGITGLRLALDFDAINKAIAIKTKYELSFPNGIEILQWPSHLDVKDMTQDEFEEIFL